MAPITRTPPSASRVAVDDPKADRDALAAQLQAAGLLETYTRDDGKVADRLTEAGGGVAKALALRHDGSAELLDSMLRPEDEVNHRG